MEEKEADKVTAFDALFTTNHIQMCKILTSYLEPPLSSMMAVYIKLAELNYTMSFVNSHPHAAFPGSSPEKPDMAKICEEVGPYMNPSEQEQLRSVANTMQSFQNIQEMMEMMQMMRELFPEGGTGDGRTGGVDNENGGSNTGFDPIGMMAGLSGMGGGENGPDIAQIMQMMQMMQGFQKPD